VTSSSTSSPAHPAAPAAEPAPPQSPSKVPGWAAAAAIILSIVIMVGAGLLRADWFPPTLVMPKVGPPWELTVQVSGRLIVWAMWVAALLGGGGIAAGLVIARRGLPVPLRTLLVVAALGVIALTLVPPVGSTDVLDYAVYGHIAALGHSPYVMTPSEYAKLAHVHHDIPRDWDHDPSVYGPLATLEQMAAAKIAGPSIIKTAFWLKLWNSIAFAAVAFAADWMWRGDRAGRLRAHLLWTVNPLLLWGGIAAGHLDILAAAVGLAGLLIVDRQLIRNPVLGAFVAGVCVGAGADIKAVFALFGAAVAWALLRKPVQLLAAAVGAAVVLVPTYALAGMPAVRALGNRVGVGLGYGFYGPIFHRIGISLNDAVPLAACLLVPVAFLALARIPAGLDDRPAIRAAVALSLTWLLLWPHQFAWYSVIAICALAFYPASRLDWLALAWIGVLTFADIPGVGVEPITSKLGVLIVKVQYNNQVRLGPMVMLVTLGLMIYWCFNRRWQGAQGPDGTALPADSR
jgi:hypothetical protein